MYRKNTAGQVVCFQLLLTASGAVATGLSPSVRRCIDGTFGAGGGTVTEDGSTGSYKYAMAQADTNGNDISLIFTATGAMPVCVNFVTTAADPTDSVRLGLTALPNAAASAVGGLPVAVDTSGRVDVLKINGTSQTARDIGASVLLSAGTGTGQLDFTSGVVKSNLVQILATALTETAGQIAAGFKKFFNVGSPAMDVTSVNQTGDSYARLGAPAGASHAADVAAVKTDTGAIKTQTDKMAFTVTNQIDANALSLNGDATSAANIAKTTKAIGRATVSGSPSTTSIPTSACTPAGAAADQFKGRIITFDANTTTTALRGQSTDITASSNSATPTFTVSALTTAPSSGDTFSIT